MSLSLNGMVEQTFKYISSSNVVLLLTHERPDGDAIGSLMAMFHMLKIMNKRCMAVVPDSLPEGFHFINGITNIYIYDKNPHPVDLFLLETDLVVCVDMNKLERGGQIGKIIKGKGKDAVFIDHHPYHGEEPPPGIIWERASSASEVVAYFMEKTIPHILFSNTSIMEALMAGIISDTGRFLHPTNIISSLGYVYKFIQNGADYMTVIRNIYRVLTPSRVQCIGYALYKKTSFHEQIGTAVVVLTSDDLKSFSIDYPDTEYILTMLMRIKSVVLSAIIIEQDGYCKVSLRSRGEVDVGDMAKKYFHGGGHKNASSGKLNLSIDRAVFYFYDVLKNYHNYLAEITKKYKEDYYNV